MWGIPLKPMGILLQSCVNLHEPIELSFRVVTGVDLGIIHVLDGGPDASRGMAVLGDFHATGLNGAYTHTHTTHTTVLRLCGICPGKPG